MFPFSFATLCILFAQAGIHVVMPTGALEITTDMSQLGHPSSCQYSLTEEHAKRRLSVESHPSPKGECGVDGGAQWRTRSCHVCLSVFVCVRARVCDRKEIFRRSLYNYCRDYRRFHCRNVSYNYAVHQTRVFVIW